MNRDETEKAGLSPAQLDMLFARSGEHLVNEAAARRHSAEWPWLIEKTLGWLLRRSAAHADTLATIEDRIAALEAAAGSAKA